MLRWLVVVAGAVALRLVKWLILRGLQWFPFKGVLDFVYFRSRLLQRLFRLRLGYISRQSRWWDDWYGVATVDEVRIRFGYDSQNSGRKDEDTLLMHRIHAISPPRGRNIVLVAEHCSQTLSLVGEGSLVNELVLRGHDVYVCSLTILDGQARSLRPEHFSRMLQYVEDKGGCKPVVIGFSLACHQLMQWWHYVAPSLLCMQDQVHCVLFVAPIIWHNNGLFDVFNRAIRWTIEWLWSCGRIAELSEWQKLLHPKAYDVFGRLCLRLAGMNITTSSSHRLQAVDLSQTLRLKMYLDCVGERYLHATVLDQCSSNLARASQQKLRLLLGACASDRHSQCDSQCVVRAPFRSTVDLLCNSGCAAVVEQVILMVK